MKLKASQIRKLFRHDRYLHLPDRRNLRVFRGEYNGMRAFWMNGYKIVLSSKRAQN